MRKLPKQGIKPCSTRLKRKATEPETQSEIVADRLAIAQYQPVNPQIAKSAYDPACNCINAGVKTFQSACRWILRCLLRHLLVHAVTVFSGDLLEN